MTAKINQLTPEQWSSVERERLAWLAHGLDTTQSDRATAERVIAGFYARISKPAPRFVWLASPLACCEAAGPDNRQKIFACRNFAGWRIAWVAWYSVARDVAGVAYTPENDALLREWSELLRAFSGWWFPFEGVCLMSERPEKISHDDRGRLHCADGPAVLHRDGYATYAWHGTRVSAKVITAPETYTAAELSAERNSEVHRALGEKLGWARYLELLDVSVVDRWVDPTTGLDYELCDSKTRVGELQPRFLKMRSPALFDGSQPHFVEPVEPGLKTAQAARKWQFKLSRTKAAEYRRHGDIVIVSGAKEDSLYWPTAEECNKNPEMTFLEEK